MTKILYNAKFIQNECCTMYRNIFHIYKVLVYRMLDIFFRHSDWVRIPKLLFSLASIPCMIQWHTRRTLYDLFRMIRQIYRCQLLGWFLNHHVTDSMLIRTIFNWTHIDCISDTRVYIERLSSTSVPIAISVDRITSNRFADARSGTSDLWLSWIDHLHIVLIYVVGALVSFEFMNRCRQIFTLFGDWWWVWWNSGHDRSISCHLYIYRFNKVL